MTAALEEVRLSRKFARLLELILLFGNFMNAGSRNEQTFGFELSYITKVSSTYYHLVAKYYVISDNTCRYK